MSTIRATTLSNLAGSQTISTDRVAQGTAFAWVNFNGTGTVAIRGSYNVTSITDNGTGNYTVNFTAAAPDANYSAQVTTSGSGAGGICIGGSTVRVAASCTVQTTTSGATVDNDYVGVTIFR